MINRVRVLIVDGSQNDRQFLKKVLESDPALHVVATANDAYDAREKIVRFKPDVMTLDIQMSRMDGVSFLEAVMKHHPVRTLVVTSTERAGSQSMARSKEAGAIDVVLKPPMMIEKPHARFGEELKARVKLIAKAPFPQLLASAIKPFSNQILAIASSTGGTEALKDILPYLPADIPAIVIAQHMPSGFTRTFAEALDKLCKFSVREARDGDRVVAGQVFVAPGDYHMEVVKKGAQYFVKLHQEALLHGVRPAADYLMRSVAACAGPNAIGLVLTGMGRDGAAGLREMKKAGASTIAQDEKSSVVFGMPKEALNTGAVDRVVPLDQIAGELINHFKRLRARSAA